MTVLNKIHVKFGIIFILLFFVESIIAADLIKHESANNHRDQQKTYYIALLQLAIEKAQPKYGEAVLQAIGTNMVYKRRLKSLNSGDIDIMWALTSEQREMEMLPIRIPVFKGLSGFKVMVIQDVKQQELSHTTSTQQIKNMLALQGKDWLHTDILRANGFKVHTTDWYDSLYKGVSSGIFDYFPRPVLEPWEEMKTYRYNNLAVEAKQLLYYPAAMYYFVKKDNQALAQRIEYGLNQAIDDGSFDKLLYNYPAHREALSKSKLNTRIVHKLSNPYLPKSTPLTDTRLWHAF